MFQNALVKAEGDGNIKELEKGDLYNDGPFIQACEFLRKYAGADSELFKQLEAKKDHAPQSKNPSALSCVKYFLNDLTNPLAEFKSSLAKGGRDSAAPMRTRNEERKGRFTWSNLHEHPLKTAGTLILLTAGTTWAVVQAVQVAPLRDRMEAQREKITELENELQSASTSARGAIKVTPELPPQRFSYKIVPGPDRDKAYIQKSPANLWTDVENLNSSDRESFIRDRYSDKWISFAGLVHYVHLDKNYGFVDFDNGIMKVRMSVDSSGLPQLLNLRKGEEISIQGKFNVVWEGYANFTNSKLIK